MDVKIERDIVFGEARVGYDGGRGAMASVPLKLDAYLPSDEQLVSPPRPALIMAFGGAFHRGSKDNDAFTDGKGTSTAVAEYCRRFAAEGHPAFSVEYRLAQSDPDPGTSPVLTRPDEIPMSRINPVRVELGLPPVSAREMAGVMEAAFEDVANAVRFVRANATRFGVDVDRIVLGGFSAGGRSAMYAAYGKRVEVAAVVSLSGPLVPADADVYLAKGGVMPPLTLVSGERDLDYVVEFVPQIAAKFRTAGRPVEHVLVPGGTHFYAAEARTDDGRTVIEVVRDALARVAQLPRQTAR